jgi:hypothetical protein
MAFEETLAGYLGSVIPFDGSIANAFFANQLER